MGSAFIDRDTLPIESIAERDGWELSVQYHGTYSQSIDGVAWYGDHRGAITLKGPGDIRVGLGIAVPNWLLFLPHWFDEFSINLLHGRKVIRKLGEQLQSVYNQEPDWILLHQLGKQAFEPFDSYY